MCLRKQIRYHLVILLCFLSCASTEQDGGRQRNRDYDSESKEENLSYADTTQDKKINAGSPPNANFPKFLDLRSLQNMPLVIIRPKIPVKLHLIPAQNFGNSRHPDSGRHPKSLDQGTSHIESNLRIQPKPQNQFGPHHRPVQIDQGHSDVRPSDSQQKIAKYGVIGPRQFQPPGPPNGGWMNRIRGSISNFLPIMNAFHRPPMLFAAPTITNPMFPPNYGNMHPFAAAMNRPMFLPPFHHPMARPTLYHPFAQPHQGYGGDELSAFASTRLPIGAMHPSMIRPHPMVPHPGMSFYEGGDLYASASGPVPVRVPPPDSEPMTSASAMYPSKIFPSLKNRLFANYASKFPRHRPLFKNVDGLEATSMEMTNAFADFADSPEHGHDVNQRFGAVGDSIDKFLRMMGLGVSGFTNPEIGAFGGAGELASLESTPIARSMDYFPGYGNQAHLDHIDDDEIFEEDITELFNKKFTKPPTTTMTPMEAKKNISNAEDKKTTIAMKPTNSPNMKSLLAQKMVPKYMDAPMIQYDDTSDEMRGNQMMVKPDQAISSKPTSPHPPANDPDMKPPHIGQLPNIEGIRINFFMEEQHPNFQDRKIPPPDDTKLKGKQIPPLGNPKFYYSDYLNNQGKDDDGDSGQSANNMSFPHVQDNQHSKAQENQNVKVQDNQFAKIQGSQYLKDNQDNQNVKVQDNQFATIQGSQYLKDNQDNQNVKVQDNQFAKIQGSQYLKDNQDNQYPKGNQDNQYHKGNQDNQHPKGNQYNQHHKDNQDNQHHKDNQDNQHHKGNQDNQYPKSNQDNQYPKSHQGNRDPKGHQENHHPKDNQDNQHPKGNQYNQHPKGNHDNQHPKGNQGNQYPKGNQDNQYPKGNQDNQHAKGNKDNQFHKSHPDNQFHKSHPDNRDPKGHADNRDPKGHPDNRDPKGHPDNRDPKGHQENQQPEGHQENQHLKGNQDNWYPKVNQDNQFPMGNQDNQHPKGNQDNQHPKGNQENQHPKSNQDNQYHRGHPGNRDPKDHQENQYPKDHPGNRDPKGHQDNRDPKGHPDNRDPKGHPDNRDPKGHPDNRDPKGHPDNRDPKGHQENQHPEGHQENQHLKGNQDNWYPKVNQDNQFPMGNQDNQHPKGNQDNQHPKGNQENQHPKSNQDNQYHRGHPGNRDPKDHQENQYPKDHPGNRDPKGHQENQYPKGHPGNRDPEDHQENQYSKGHPGNRDTKDHQENQYPKGHPGNRDPKNHQENQYLKSHPGNHESKSHQGNQYVKGHQDNQYFSIRNNQYARNQDNQYARDQHNQYARDQDNQYAKNHQDNQYIKNHQTNQYVYDHQNNQYVKDNQNNQHAKDHQNNQYAKDFQDNQYSMGHPNNQYPIGHPNNQYSQVQDNRHAKFRNNQYDKVREQQFANVQDNQYARAHTMPDGPQSPNVKYHAPSPHQNKDTIQQQNKVVHSSVNYNVPLTHNTASPEDWKPPILIYQNLPPVQEHRNGHPRAQTATEAEQKLAEQYQPTAYASAHALPANQHHVPGESTKLVEDGDGNDWSPVHPGGP